MKKAKSKWYQGQGDAIVELLMRRDGLTKAEANRKYKSARAEFQDALAGTNGRDPEDVLAEDLGIEPDYIFEFI